MRTLTRRALLIAGVLTGGGLALGVALCPDRLSRRGAGEGDISPVTWLRIGTDGTVTVLSPHVEMGQGTHTALAMMLAEELDVPWSHVRVEQAPAESTFATGDVVRAFLLEQQDMNGQLARRLDMLTYQVARLADLQITGGSLSVRSTGRLGMRRAGAMARAMLVGAAADEWRVPVEECAVADGVVLHAASGRRAGFGALAVKAAQMPLPGVVQLKRRAEYRLCGTSPALVHSAAAVTGALEYGCDVQLPGLVHAAIRHAPVFGTRLRAMDATKVEGMPGILGVLALPAAVAVVAEGYWQAEKALAQVAMEFSSPESPPLDDASLDRLFVSLLDAPRLEIDHAMGDVDGEEARVGSRVFEQIYAVPYLAHATMEPMNCTAWIHDGRLEIWTGTQDPLGTRAIAARTAGFREADVVVHPCHLGGGFGRRTPGSFDFIEDAVRIAQRVARPVRLQWSREEDIRHDRYRPAGMSRFRAVLDDAGLPASWRQVYTDTGFNQDRDAARIPYSVPSQRIGRAVAQVPVPLGYWRSVEHSYQGYFMESFVDELATLAGQDPVSYRLSLLRQAPRHARVLLRAAEMIGWREGVAAGRGLGIAVKESFGTVVAQAAEVSLLQGRVVVHRICSAVDAGEIVHPHNARAQIEGAVCFALGAALDGRISLSGGSVVQGNFHDYRILTQQDVPALEVDLLPSDAPMGGMGEVGVPPLAAAVCNAIAAAGGPRIRRLPIAGQPVQI